MLSDSPSVCFTSRLWLSLKTSTQPLKKSLVQLFRQPYSPKVSQLKALLLLLKTITIRQTTTNRMARRILRGARNNHSEGMISSFCSSPPHRSVLLVEVRDNQYRWIPCRIKCIHVMHRNHRCDRRWRLGWHKETQLVCHHLCYHSTLSGSSIDDWHAFFNMLVSF